MHKSVVAVLIFLVSGAALAAELDVPLTVQETANVARLRVKWAEKPMVPRLKLPGQAETHANWWAAHNADGELAPEPGKRQSMTVEGVSAGTRYFAIRSFDAASNRSALSGMAKVEVK